MIGDGLTFLRKWFIRLVIIGALIGGVGGATVMHTMVTNLYHDVTVLVTGHSGIHLPTVKKG